MDHGVHGVSYYRQVVLKIPGVAGGNAQQDFTFEDQPDVRYARMQSMRYYTDADCAAAMPANIPMLPAQFMPLVTFVFETNDPDDLPMQGDPGKKSKGDAGRFTGTLDTIQWIPASDLHVTQSFGIFQPAFVREPITWKDRYIIWQKSHVKLSAPILNTVDVAIVLGCFYSFTTSKGQVIFPRN